MTLDEIANITITLTIDADEARILAAACKLGAADLDGSTLPISPLRQFGSSAMLGMLLDGYTALFEAASMAGAAHFGLNQSEGTHLTLSGIREHGTGARFMTDESEGTR